MLIRNENSKKVSKIFHPRHFVASTLTPFYVKIKNKLLNQANYCSNTSTLLFKRFHDCISTS